MKGKLIHNLNKEKRVSRKEGDIIQVLKVFKTPSLIRWPLKYLIVHPNLSINDVNLQKYNVYKSKGRIRSCGFSRIFPYMDDGLFYVRLHKDERVQEREMGFKLL